MVRRARRKASDALSELEQRFLDEGKQAGPDSKQASKHDSMPATQARKPITVRLEIELYRRLWKACALRRAERVEPYSMQAVVEAAVSKYLDGLES